MHFSPTKNTRNNHACKFTCTIDDCNVSLSVAGNGIQRTPLSRCASGKQALKCRTKNKTFYTRQRKCKSCLHLADASYHGVVSSNHNCLSSRICARFACASESRRSSPRACQCQRRVPLCAALSPTCVSSASPHR